jgi:hypothetical protein
MVEREAAAGWNASCKRMLTPYGSPILSGYHGCRVAPLGHRVWSRDVAAARTEQSPFSAGPRGSEPPDPESTFRSPHLSECQRKALTGHARPAWALGLKAPSAA